jgi:hypothetical protein
MTTPENIEKAIARLTAEAKLCAWLYEVEAHLLDEGTGRAAIFGTSGRTSELCNEPRQPHHQPVDQPHGQPGLTR